MAKPAHVELDPAAPFAEAAAATVRVRADELFAHAGADMDVDGVHDTRVATRRLRAALEVYAPCFPRKRWRKALAEVKRLADALGARRDPDVQLEAIDAMAARLEIVGRDDLEALRAEVLAERDAGEAVVQAALARARERDLHGRLLELAKAAR